MADPVYFFIHLLIFREPDAELYETLKNGASDLHSIDIHTYVCQKVYRISLQKTIFFLGNFVAVVITYIS